MLPHRVVMRALDARLQAVSRTRLEIPLSCILKLTLGPERISDQSLFLLRNLTFFPARPLPEHNGNSGFGVHRRIGPIT
jgi:hypothetical protein